AVGLGAAIKFIPYPVVTGFTSGIALIIFSQQIRDLLGLDLEDLPPEFIHQWRAYAANIGSADLPTVAIAALAVTIILLWPRVSRKIPAPFVALIATTLLVRLLDIPVETIGSRFGAIPSSIPRPSFPAVSMEMVTALIGPAFTIALLAGIESLLSAV